MITLKTLKDATAQEVFDQVKEHLLTQKERCEDGLSCRYRENDLKCAAGCLIGDDEYTNDMELDGWRHLVEAGIVPSHHKNLISQLQNIHDSCDIENWRYNLYKLAKYEGLKFNV